MMLSEAAKFKRDWKKRQRKAIEAGVDCAYLYVHLEADSGEPFYIGMGETKTRPWDGGRSDKHKNRANKHGMIVHVDAAPVLSDPIAKWWEVRWIKAFRDAGYDLVNLTDGGDGTKGHKHPKEICDKISKRMSANNPHHIPEVAEKLSGDNHWTRQDGVITPFHGESNPSKKKENVDRMIYHNPMQNPEVAEAVAKKNRGGKRSPESIAAQSAKTRGVPKTEAHNKANSIGCKNYWDSLTPEQRIARGKQMAETRRRNKLLKEGIA